tara:strand:+ start:13219 stop:14115 length:897 start_codon:yes stop_codon:yes gene_type:complete
VAQEILEDIGGTLEFTSPILPGVGSSVTCELFAPTSKTAFASGTATYSAVTYLAAAVTDRDTYTAATGYSSLKVGSSYLWMDGDGWEQVIKIANLPGSDVVELESPFMDDATSGSNVRELDCTFAVSASDAADRGLNYRCEWTVTPTTGDVAKRQTMFHVVRTQFEPAITPSEAYRYAEANMAGAVLSWEPGRSIELANRASEKVRREIQSSGAYPHLVGESDAFKTAGLYALKLELAMMGFVPPGFDPGVYATTVQESLKSEIRQTLSSLTWLDSDDDGIVDSDEGLGPYTIRVQRR